MGPRLSSDEIVTPSGLPLDIQVIKDQEAKVRKRQVVEVSGSLTSLKLAGLGRILKISPLNLISYGNLDVGSIFCNEELHFLSAFTSYHTPLVVIITILS